MTQGRLFPLQITRTEPAPYGTADCTERGVGDDGMTYILKRATSASPLVPASEYLCTQLAGAIGLAVPPGAIAKMPTAPGEPIEHCFASREEGAVENAAKYLEHLCNTTSLQAHAHVLNQWRAFDLFVQNVDRHCNNFMVRATSMGAALIGIDFSRALFTQQWPFAAPPFPASNSFTCYAALARFCRFPSDAALGTLARLAAVPDDWIEACVTPVPAEWMGVKMRRDVIRWWRRRRRKRLNLLRRHCASGRYLRLCAHPRSP